MSNVNFGLIYVYLDGERIYTDDAARRGYEVHYGEIVDHVVWAEELGFDSVWLPEHHFEMDQPSHAPSPMILAAAIAARTNRIRISHNVLLAPFYHPLRLAEEAAMLAVMSNGRYDLGIGVGYAPIEFEAFGVNMKNRPSMLVECVEILRKAWTGERFSYDGKRYRFPEIAIHPVPAVKPRILIGATVDVAIRRVAHIGDGFLSAQNHDIATYLDEIAKVGGVGSAFAGQQAMVVEDVDKAIAMEGQYALQYCNDLIGRGYVDPNIMGSERFTDLQQAVDAGVYTVWDGPTAVREVTDLLRRHPEVEDVSFMVSSGPGEPLDASRARIEYLAREVVAEIRRELG